MQKDVPPFSQQKWAWQQHRALSRTDGSTGKRSQHIKKKVYLRLAVADHYAEETQLKTDCRSRHAGKVAQLKRLTRFVDKRNGLKVCTLLEEIEGITFASTIFLRLEASLMLKSRCSGTSGRASCF